MSSNATPSKAHLFLDGDGYRAPAGTPLPDDPWAETWPAPWEAFGGIEAGFGISHDRDRKAKTIWNADGNYKTAKGAKISKAKLKAVDLTKATVTTILRGGSVVEVKAPAPTADPPTLGVYRWDEGDDDVFAVGLVGREGTEAVCYHAERAELSNDPDESVDDDNLYGFDLELEFLTPDGGGRPFVRYGTSDVTA